MSKNPVRSRFAVIPRIVSYAFLVVLCTVLISAAFPPVFGPKSVRAVVNAPVTALSSPISGRVLYTGQTNAIATIVNDRVDQTTLIHLKIELARAEHDLAFNEAMLPDLKRRLADLEKEFEALRDADIVRTTNDLRHAQIRLELATYDADNQKIVSGRKLHLNAKGVHPGSKSEFQNEIHLQDALVQSAKIELEIVRTNLEYARQGVFVGEGRESLRHLQQEIRVRTAELGSLSTETVHQKNRIAELRYLVNREQQHVDLLERALIAADPTAVVYKTLREPGSQVHAGDEVAEVLRCEEAFVVAIFSERQAQQLMQGSSNVIINNPEWAGSVDGRVMRLVPRTTQRVDRDYAVPFPATERRELYAYVKPNSADLPTLEGGGLCSVGAWVTVASRPDWIDRTREQVHAGLMAFVHNTLMWASFPAMRNTDQQRVEAPVAALDRSSASNSRP